VNTTEAVKAVVRAAPDARYVSSLGTSTSALILATGDGPHVYMGGAMGSGLAVAIGVADRRREDRVIGIIGDGDLLMGSSALWTMAGLELPNLTAVIISDRSYSITGGQALVADASSAGVASALGIRAVRVAGESALEACIAEDRCRLVEATVEPGAAWPGPSPFVDPYRVRTRFRAALAGASPMP
jgi:thiamine pyrophosphate-dependent acetolactate synthase large subunit-like protein